jgi:hypothetical protein
MTDMINKKKELLEKEFDRLRHNLEIADDIHDEEFLRKKYSKINEKTSIDIDDLADINIGDDLPVTEKKTKEERFMK